MMKLSSALIFIMASSFVFLTGCSENAEQDQMLRKAVAIESSDECHLCGMLISRFDGPKGEAIRKDQQNTTLKFCSTRDLFSYYLDPENKRNIVQMLVHDMSKMPWESINDEHFIDAKTAWYVSGSEKTGAMGVTLASFSQKTDAQAFADEFGGKVLSFEKIRLNTLM